MTPHHPIIIVDLEATCWEDRKKLEHMETIEIGAVKLARFGQALHPVDEFSAFVRPRNNPVLSAFCTSLTSIRQQDVDRAGPFPEIFAAFVDWAGPPPFTWASWGGYDRKQLRQDCASHRIEFPSTMKRHINLRERFCQLQGLKKCTMKQALKKLGLPLEGTHHRGIDDARNISRIAAMILV